MREPWQSRGRTLRAIRTGTRAAFGALGYDIHRKGIPRFVDHGPHEPHVNRARIMRRREIDLVLDIGANEGQYGVELRSTGYAGRIVSFEPASEAFAALERTSCADALWDCHRYAIGDGNRDVRLHVAAASAYSSLLPLPENGERTRLMSVEVVPARRLDTLFDGLAEGQKALLKIDVQGFELKVLGGAGRLLDDLEAVEVELSVVEVYPGQALYREVLDLLEGRGFSLVGVDPGFTDKESAELLQLDALLVRSRST
jgi:FkbM family methyltransferase